MSSQAAWNAAATTLTDPLAVRPQLELSRTGRQAIFHQDKLIKSLRFALRKLGIGVTGFSGFLPAGSAAGCSDLGEPVRPGRGRDSTPRKMGSDVQRSWHLYRARRYPPLSPRTVALHHGPSHCTSLCLSTTMRATHTQLTLPDNWTLPRPENVNDNDNDNDRQP